MGEIDVQTDDGRRTFETIEYGGCTFVYLPDPQALRTVVLPSWVDKASRHHGFVKIRHNPEMGMRCPARCLRAIFKIIKRGSHKHSRRQPEQIEAYEEDVWRTSETE